jgi:hypothetical protein
MLAAPCRAEIPCIRFHNKSYSMLVFLRLGSAEPQGFANGGQRFRETKMLNGERVLLAVQNCYVRM